MNSNHCKHGIGFCVYIIFYMLLYIRFKTWLFTRQKSSRQPLYNTPIPSVWLKHILPVNAGALLLVPGRTASISCPPTNSQWSSPLPSPSPMLRNLSVKFPPRKIWYLQLFVKGKII